MIRVGLDLSSEPARPTGIGTYALNLAAALGKLGDRELEFLAFASPSLPLDGVPSAPTPFGDRAYGWRRAFQQAVLPGYATARRIDVLHTVNNLGPLLWPGPLVLSVHDTKLYQAAKGASLARRLYRRGLHRESARRATLVLTESEWTRSDLVNSLGVDPERIRVIRLGIDADRFNPALADADVDQGVLARHGLGQRPYVLAVGTREPTKNLTRALEAFAAVASRHADLQFVLCGGKGWGDQDLEAQATRLGVRNRVHPLGYVDFEDLPALYRGAKAFVFPSLAEGFGFPILEAYASETPVVTSTVSACPETAGGAALLVDPLDVEAIAQALGRLLDDEALCADHVARGLAWVGECTWERCARETAAAYREALQLA